MKHGHSQGVTFVVTGRAAASVLGLLRPRLMGQDGPQKLGKKDPKMGFFIISIPEKGTGLLSGAISALRWDVRLWCLGWEQGIGRGTRTAVPLWVLVSCVKLHGKHSVKHKIVLN